MTQTYYQNRLNGQIDALKQDHGYIGVAFFVESSSDITTEDVAKDASMMLDDFLSGNAEDITDTVR